MPTGRRRGWMWIASLTLLLGTAGAARAGLLGIGGDFVLYDLNPSTGAASNPRPVGNKVTNIALAPSGTLYGVSQGTPGDQPPGGRLYTIQIASGAATLVADLDTFMFTEGDIAFDPTTGILYAVDGPGTLFTINTSTGAGTVIGAVGSNLDLSAMAFDAAGNLYVVDSFGPTLVRVNKSTAAVIASVSLAPVGQQVGGLAFSPGGVLFHSADIPSALHTVNTGSGAATLVGPIPVNAGIWGLAFTPEPTPAGTTTWGRVKSLYR